MVQGLPDSRPEGSTEGVPPLIDVDHTRDGLSLCYASRTGAGGVGEEFLWLLESGNPVHLNDDHAFGADVGQVDEHQRASLDGAQPRRLACDLPPVEEDHRFADGQFLGYLT